MRKEKKEKDENLEEKVIYNACKKMQRYPVSKFTPEQINNIIDLRGNDGRKIDIFKLHGVLFVGNTEDSTWDLSKNYFRLSEHILPISIEDFDDCETEEDVRNTFSEELEEVIIDKLL